MKIKLIVVLIGLLSLPPAGVSAQDFSGQWLGTITESLNRCENLGKAEPGDYKLTIVHKDGEILLMENVEQVPFRGVVNPKRPQNVHVQGAYNDDGGYVTQMIDIVFADETAGRGQSVWNWSDGYHSCGGRFNFMLEKIR